MTGFHESWESQEALADPIRLYPGSQPYVTVSLVVYDILSGVKVTASPITGGVHDHTYLKKKRRIRYNVMYTFDINRT